MSADEHDRPPLRRQLARHVDRVITASAVAHHVGNGREPTQFADQFGEVGVKIGKDPGCREPPKPADRNR